MVPLIVIIIVYLLGLVRTVCGARGQQQIKSVNGNDQKQNVSRMCIIVFVIFAICWGPIHIMLNLKSNRLITVSTFNLLFHIAAQVVAFMNSCVNPILYAILSDKFRTAFLSII